MELELFAQHILYTRTSLKGSLEVLPFGEEKKTQKFAVGDLCGVVQCLVVRKGEVQTSFKTLQTDQPVTSLVLGKGRLQRDKIFFVSGNTIRGITKQGKEFFKFKTLLTETISKINIFEKNIWSAGEFVHNHFVEGKDLDCFLSPDRINGAEIVPLSDPGDMQPVIACQDRCIRVLSGSEVLLKTNTPSTPVTLRYIHDSHDPLHRFPEAKELLYATSAGTLNQLMLSPDGAQTGFVLPNTKKLGSIRGIHSGEDISKTGVNDIAIGREDGSLEIYDMNEQGELQQIYGVNISESINSLNGGFITSLNVPEILLHSFSGKVIAYTPPGGGMLLPEENKPSWAINEEKARKHAYDLQISRLRNDLEELKRQVDEEKRRFRSIGGNTALLSEGGNLTLSHHCKLEADEACYVLTIESSAPIFTVAIQSNIALELLDVPTNVAILSRSQPDPKNSSATLATYRCQDATGRLSIKFKLKEGSGGLLQAFIVPNVVPKTCTTIQHKVHPLCLHSRTSEPDVTRPSNGLVITGAFDLYDMHGWVSSLLPDVPPVPPGSHEMSLAFHNTLLGTQLTCRYETGEARFTSDLVSTLGIIHTSVMQQATQAKQRCSTNFQPSSESLRSSLRMVWPEIEKQRDLKRNVLILEGLLELKTQDSEVMTYMPPEYKKILDNMERVRADHKTMPQHLEHLVSIIKDLYLDFCKLSGIPAQRQRLPRLEQLLLEPSSTQEEVVDFILGAEGSAGCA